MPRRDTPTVYRIDTERLVIRCWEPTDGPALREALDRNDEHLRPFIPWMRDEPKPLAETVSWLRANRARFDRDEDYRYGIFDHSGHLLGETGLYTRAGEGAREVGYWLDHRAGGRGYATEAALAVVQVAFAIDRVERVELHVAPENHPSVAVASRLGFRHEANLPRRSRDSEGVIRDTMIWSLHADTWMRSPASDLPLTAYDCLGRPVVEAVRRAA